MIRKADIILALVIIVLGGILTYYASFGSSQGDTIYITVDGKEFGSYSLAENRDITVKQNGHINKVTIKDGSVSMFFSDCSNQVCVNTGAIGKTNQSIVCLPNKVMIQIVGRGEAEYDAVSN